MMKKAQGLSINVIIVAAIALIVLVILGVIFMGRMGLFAGQSADCEANGGNCRVGECEPEERLSTGFVCEKTAQEEDQVCCVGIPG